MQNRSPIAKRRHRRAGLGSRHRSEPNRRRSGRRHRHLVRPRVQLRGKIERRAGGATCCGRERRRARAQGCATRRSRAQRCRTREARYLGVEWSISVPRDAVKVRVEGGWITLTGDVDWAYAREAAASYVRSLIGIKGVVNNIAVHPKVALENVKTEIEAALQRRVHADVKGIKVTVQDGTVDAIRPCRFAGRASHDGKCGLERARRASCRR